MAMRLCYRKHEEEREKKLVCGCAPRSHGIHQDEPAGWFLGATAESNRRFGPTKLLATGEISCKRCTHIAYVRKGTN